MADDPPRNMDILQIAIPVSDLERTKRDYRVHPGFDLVGCAEYAARYSSLSERRLYAEAVPSSGEEPPSPATIPITLRSKLPIATHVEKQSSRLASALRKSRFFQAA